MPNFCLKVIVLVNFTKNLPIEKKLEKPISTTNR